MNPGVGDFEERHKTFQLAASTKVETISGPKMPMLITYRTKKSDVGDLKISLEIVLLVQYLNTVISTPEQVDTNICIEL